MKIRGKTLTRRQKEFLAKQGVDSNDFLFVGETVYDPDTASFGSALNRTTPKSVIWTFVHRITGKRSTFIVEHL